jgi:hypothetical protein
VLAFSLRIGLAYLLNHGSFFFSHAAVTFPFFGICGRIILISPQNAKRLSGGEGQEHQFYERRKMV